MFTQAYNASWSLSSGHGRTPVNVISSGEFEMIWSISVEEFLVVLVGFVTC